MKHPLQIYTLDKNTVTVVEYCSSDMGGREGGREGGGTGEGRRGEGWTELQCTQQTGDFK